MQFAHGCEDVDFGLHGDDGVILYVISVLEERNASFAQNTAVQQLFFPEDNRGTAHSYTNMVYL
jgi:hypothetical protein